MPGTMPAAFGEISMAYGDSPLVTPVKVNEKPCKKEGSWRQHEQESARIGALPTFRAIRTLNFRH
jgi:hypothetical protein